MAQRPRVLIVGAGLAGCATAWHLAPDHDVLVVDQGSDPGAEATAQNAGMVRRLGEDPAERALALRTHDFLAAPGPDWTDLTVSRRTGALLGLSQDRWHLHDAVAHLRAHGVTVESVEGAEVARLAPALRDSPLQQGWWLPDERIADRGSLDGYRPLP